MMRSGLSENPDKNHKKSLSYTSLLQKQLESPYNTIGADLCQSNRQTAPRAVFGSAQKKSQNKMLAEEAFMKTISGGKQGKGPASYLPSRYNNQQGKQVQRPDIESQLKYTSVPSFSIGREPRKGEQLPYYAYMNSRNDQLQVNNADLKRKYSSPSFQIGNQTRFQDEQKYKKTPGPTYDGKLRPDAHQAPKYSFRLKMSLPGSDPLVPAIGTNRLVGPATYFKDNKNQKSHSTTSLARVPNTSRIRNEPIISFPKGSRTLSQYKNSTDETYDLKTNTIMAHYDFEYDGGKGQNTGRAWEKKYLGQCSQNPIQRNKMKSFTIARSSRQKQDKRGTFISMMSQVPVSVRMNVPKF